jgi:intein/homing endonuclease
MTLYNIPQHTNLADGQFIQIIGPDGVTTGYSYDEQQRALYFKESQVLFPSFHGLSHISGDPIPGATCDTPGLMSADDKCKLESLVGTRFGVLGFQGDGFPNDNGWMSGDIILAAGTEFISLERIGNIIRFTVDSPIPLNCACFKEGARVLMSDGTTKAIEDITIGDEVITHTGQVKPVINLMRNNFSGKIANWKVDKHSGESFSITANHPVMALKREMAFFASGKVRPAVLDRPDWIEAGELGAGDLVARRRSHNMIKDIETIDVLQELGEGYIERDGLVYPHIVGGPRDGQIDGMTHGIPRYIAVDDDLLDLIGYYAAEGSADVKNGLRFTIHTDELAFGEIGSEIRRKLANVFLIEPKTQDKHTENSKDIQVCSKTLAMLFYGWVGVGETKRLPEWVMSLPAAKQRRILASLIRGDGYVTHTHSANYITLGLTARSLIDQSLFIAERCGWEPAHQPNKLIPGKSIRYRMSITTSKAHDLCKLLGVEYKPSKLNRERVIEDQVMHRINEWSEEYHDGIVYNFEVMGDNSYIVDGIVVHNCEECNQIFWVQDETDVVAVRPPVCSGKLPGVNAYGEMKIYLFPESTIVDPANASSVIQNKDRHPAFIFKRYENSIIPGSAEHQMVLKRSSGNLLQTEVGWAFTPGDQKAQMVWFMGRDRDGNQISFNLEVENTPGILGSLLYNGHLLTKRMGVIVGYTPTTLSNSQYLVRNWDLDNGIAIGESFIAKNAWQYMNVKASPTLDTPSNPPMGITDQAIDVLQVGTLVDLWAFKTGEVAGQPIMRWYFSQKPSINPAYLWSQFGHCQFGDFPEAPTPFNNGYFDTSPLFKNFLHAGWGLTDIEDNFVIYDEELDEYANLGPQYEESRKVFLQRTLPGLIINSEVAEDLCELRPVMLWNKKEVNNILVEVDMGMDFTNTFCDVILRAPIDNVGSKKLRVVDIRESGGGFFVDVVGNDLGDLPRSGSLSILKTSVPYLPSTVLATETTYGDGENQLIYTIEPLEPLSEGAAYQIGAQVEFGLFLASTSWGEDNTIEYRPVGIDLRSTLSSNDGSAGIFLSGTNNIPGSTSGNGFSPLPDYSVLYANFWGGTRTPPGLFFEEPETKYLVATLILDTTGASPGEHFISLSNFAALSQNFTALPGINGGPTFYTLSDISPLEEPSTEPPNPTEPPELTDPTEPTEPSTVPEEDRRCSTVLYYDKITVLPDSLTATPSVTLVTADASNLRVGDYVELLRQEYSSAAVRLEFKTNQSTGAVSLQFKVGTLDMLEPYEGGTSIFGENLRGMAPGYAVSSIYTQTSVYSGEGTKPPSLPNDFTIYQGGYSEQLNDSSEEYWNRLRIMLIDDQVWIWWNDMLVPPNPTLSSSLQTPAVFSEPTPYFSIENTKYGKFGCRLWPGMRIRRVNMKAQNTYYNQFMLGQLDVS